MTFSAVTTTGIYCRPGCSARPRADHVREFEFAAAAEAAGYRACLRCRPYRSATTPTPTAPELVCRGVQLIIDGILDTGSEADLGGRLGVSARHLRRLFSEHVGATPDQVARSRRTHFARRLLDDTDLSITEIAHASGFGSIRQMNRVFIEIFQARPSELRQRRRARDRLVADGGLLIRVPFQTPYDWGSTLVGLRATAIPGVESVVDDTYRRTALVDGDPAVVEVSNGGQGYLLARLHLPHWEGLIHIVQRVRRLAGLDIDHDAAVRGLQDDPLVGPLVRRRPGCRPPGAWSPFETWVRALIDHHFKDKTTADRHLTELAERHGFPVPGVDNLDLRFVFPPPETLATADFARDSLPPALADVLHRGARAVTDGALQLDLGVGHHQLLCSLAAYGTPEPAAEYLAWRLGEADAFPTDQLSALGADVGAVPRHDDGDRWRPHRATALAQLASPDLASTGLPQATSSGA